MRLLILCLLTACAPTYPPMRVRSGPRNLDFKFNVRRTVLPNGLTVALLPDPNTNLVSVDMRYMVGSAAEPVGKAGLAHLTEHIAFTLRPNGRQLDEWLRAISLDYNAFTSKLETHYTARGFLSALPELLAIEASRMHPSCALVSEDMFKRERDIVRNELHRGQTDARDAAKAVSATLFAADHPLAHDVGGDDDSLSRLTRADVCAFMLRHYVPSRAVLVVSGPIDEKSAIELVGKTFTTPKIDPPSPVVLIPPVLDGKSVHVALAVKEPRVSVTFAAPPRGSKDDALGSLLSHALDHIAKQMRRGKYIVSSELHEQPGEGNWTFDFAVKELSDREHAVTVLFENIDRTLYNLKAVWDDPARFDYATLSFRSFRSQAIGEEIQSLQHPSLRTSTVADALTYGHDATYMSSRFSTLTKADAASLHKLAAELLDRKRSLTLFIDPTSGPELKPQLISGSEHRVLGTAGPADKPVDLPTLSLKVHEETLANGMRIWFAPSEGFPLVNASLVFNAGVDDGPNACAAELSARLLFPALGHNEVTTIMRAGAGTRILVGRNTTEFNVSGIGSYQDIILWQVGAHVFGANYNQVPIDVGLVPGLKPDDEDIKRSKASSAFFGMPTCEDPIGDYTLESVESFRQTHFLPQRATLILTGSWTPETVAEAKQIYESFEPLRGPAPAPKKVEARVGNRVVLANERAKQAKLLLAFALPEEPSERAAQLVVEALIDERIKRLRTDRVVSYSVNASLSEAYGPNALIIAGDFDQTRSEEAMTALREYISSAATDQFQDAFVRARQTAVERVLWMFSDSTRLTNALYALARTRLPLSTAETLLHDVSAVTQDQVRSILKRDLTDARLSVMIEGSKATAIKAAESFGGKRPIVID